MLLVISSLGAGTHTHTRAHTRAHTHTYTHTNTDIATDFSDKSNFKTPYACQPNNFTFKFKGSYTHEKYFSLCEKSNFQ